MPRFTVETRKNWQGYTWSNSYHVEAETSAAARLGASALANFEEALLSNQIIIVDTKTATWPDPSGQQFWIDPFNFVGDRNMTMPQGREMALFVKIPAASGHSGKKWLRGSLDVSDIETIAGRTVLQDEAPVKAAFDAASTTLMNDLGTLGVELLIGAVPLTARLHIPPLAIQGVGYRDPDVGWYDHQD